MDMQKIADKFQREHRGKGTVSHVTDYSFQYTTLPDKNGKTESCTYMLSYFLEL